MNRTAVRLAGVVATVCGITGAVCTGAFAASTGLGTSHQFEPTVGRDAVGGDGGIAGSGGAGGNQGDWNNCAVGANCSSGANGADGSDANGSSVEVVDNAVK